MMSTCLECACYFQPHSIPVWVKSKCPSSLNLALNTTKVSGSARSPDLAFFGPLQSWAAPTTFCQCTTSCEHCVRTLCAEFTSGKLAAHIRMHMHKQDVKRMGVEIWNIGGIHSLNTKVISGIPNTWGVHQPPVPRLRLEKKQFHQELQHNWLRQKFQLTSGINGLVLQYSPAMQWST